MRTAMLDYMKMENRVIRISNELWERVVEQAEWNNWSVPHFIRQRLWKATEDKPCFLCGQPAVMEIRAPLSKSDDLTMEQMFAELKSTGHIKTKYTPIELSIYTCSTHTDATFDYLEDRGVSRYGYTRRDEQIVRPSVQPDNPAYIAVQSVIDPLLPQ